VGFYEHAETFAGHRVKDYDPEAGIKRSRAATPTAYRLTCEDDGGDLLDEFPELLDRFLNEPGAAGTTGLVVGIWDYEGMMRSGNRVVVEALAAARDRLPGLRALFLGDIIRDECEVSWIRQGDVSPLLAAFPRLEHFKVRGSGLLTFGALRHDHLRALVLESGGLPEGILAELYAAHLPRLEHLELWLGSPDYGGIPDPVALVPLLRGRAFPRLRHLGLRNSTIADLVAQAVAFAPVLRRLEVLDLALGALGDDGARALLASPAVRRLGKLDIHHHYVSPEVVKQLKGLGIEIDAGQAGEPHHFADGTEYRYIAASE
jgi:hypothetical protein